MVQLIFLFLFGISSIAQAQRIPAFEARVLNLTQFHSDQIKVQVIGETTHSTIGAGSKVCSEVSSGYLPLVSDIFRSPEMRIPPCQNGWGIGQRSRILFYIDPIQGEYSFPKSSVGFESLPKKYPNQIVFLEIPNTNIAVTMADGSDALNWFESKSYPIFRLNVLDSQNKSIMDHYQSAILYKSTRPEFMLDEKYLMIPNLGAESAITVVTEIGSFGIKKVYYRNQMRLKLSELKPYLESLTLTIKP